MSERMHSGGAEVEKADKIGRELAEKHQLSEEAGGEIALLITERGASPHKIDELLEKFPIDSIVGAYEVVRTSEAYERSHATDEIIHPPTIEGTARALTVFENSEDEIYSRLKQVTAGLGLKYSSTVLNNVTDFAEKNSIVLFDDACDSLYDSLQ